MSRMPYQKPWRPRRAPVSVLAEMAIRRERIVQRLRELREAHGLTQEQAAARVGVNLRQWQRWEAGDSMPYPRNLDLIASKFGTTVNEFFEPPETQLVARSELEEILAYVQRVDAKLERLLAATQDDDSPLGELVAAMDLVRQQAEAGAHATPDRQKRGHGRDLAGS